MKNSSKRILLLNDSPGCGNIALNAMTPALKNYGYEVFTLPTAVISNPLNYGKHAMVDMTDYMKDAIRVWEDLSFSFDAIATGFLASHEQALFLEDYCRKMSDRNCKIFCDPIMADHGKFYRSKSSENVEDFKRILKYADYCVPNYTEGCFLSGVTYCEDGLSREKMIAMIEKIRELGPKSVIITGTKVDGQDVCAGYDGTNDFYFMVPYNRLPVNVSGAGDLFLAMLIGEIMKDSSEALENIVEKVSVILCEQIKKQS